MFAEKSPELDIVLPPAMEQDPIEDKQDEEMPPDPFFSMQGIASNQGDNVVDEQESAPMDNVDIKDGESASILPEEQSQANTPIVSQGVVEKTPTEEELLQQEKEEQKKKRRELKNIFRQF